MKKPPATPSSKLRRDGTKPAKPAKPPPPIEPLDDDEDGGDDDEDGDGDGEHHDGDDDDDDEHHDGDDEHHELMAVFEKVMTTYWLKSKAWPKVIKTIGPEKFGQFIATLQAIYDKYQKTSAVKSAADRAEAKSAKKMEKPDAKH